MQAMCILSPWFIHEAMQEASEVIMILDTSIQQTLGDISYFVQQYLCQNPQIFAAVDAICA